MTRKNTSQFIGVVEAAQPHSEFTRAYSACKTAVVPFAVHKEGRFLVHSINDSD